MDDADQNKTAHIVENGGADEDGANACLREFDASGGRGAVDDDKRGAERGRGQGDTDNEGF
jgi:hypothetical protein